MSQGCKDCKYGKCKKTSSGYTGNCLHPSNEIKEYSCITNTEITKHPKCKDVREEECKLFESKYLIGE